MVTDLAEILRLGTAKVEENVAFRRYLSARHYADKPFQILASEVQEHVDCTSCANCCRYSVVSVNRSQISRIAEYLGTTADEVARLYTVPDPDAPALRILRSSSEGCVFLEGNLCMIYQARPKTCRDFPHVAVGAHSLGSRQSSLAHCQVGWNLGCGPCDWRARIEFTNTKQYCGRSALPRALAFRGGKTVSGRRLEALT